jgi:UDP-N-acetylmuramoyl-tripeptide--D-alanyl-D-alanine ligase
MKIDQLYALYVAHPTVCTDTRAIAPSCLFFALKGDRFNGNTFAKQAIEAGAAYAIIDEAIPEQDDRYILVEDVLQTLQDLASFHRQQLTIPIIGITGTNGKTTTKELLYAVLSQQYRVFATKGNLNNHIGVPLSILSIRSSHEMAIIEMGANHVGEIAQLCRIAQPTAGLITNVGKAHLEGFGSFEGVKVAKGELYAYLQAHGGHLFIQGDNPHLREMASMQTFASTTTYGISPSNMIYGSLIHANPYLSVQWHNAENPESHLLTLQMTGSYNVENVLAAAAVGCYFEVSVEAIQKGLETYVPSNQRSQIVHTGRQNTLICDYYNANASSMQAALQNLDAIQTNQKVLILGDMFELGEESEEEHRAVIQHSFAIEVARRIFVGKAFYAVADAHMECYPSTDEALIALQQYPINGSFVLVKASRGMQFEKLIPSL